jgi:amino acid transporter
MVMPNPKKEIAMHHHPVAGAELSKPEGPHALQRGINKWELTLMIINSIIGAGIFGLPSKVFQSTGVYSIIAFFACAAVVLIFILCFAEVSSRFDKTGGPYIYTLSAFGKFPGFLIGWLLLVGRIFSYATLINLMVTYLSFFSQSFNSSEVRFATIIIVTLLLTYINHISVKNTARVSTVLTLAKLTPLVIFIIAGLFFLDLDLFIVKSAPAFPEFSNAVLLLVFAFGGFEAVLVNTGEIKNPSKTLPFGLLTATVVVALFYIFIQIVCIGTLPSLGSSGKPVGDAASAFLGVAGGKMIAAGAFISIIGTLNVSMFSSSRLPYAFSHENQLPGFFSFVHSRYKTPTISLLIVSFVVTIISIAWSFLTALTMAVIIRVTIYLFICLSLIVLRKKMSDQRDYFKIHAGIILGVAGVLVSIWLLSSAKMVELRNASIVLGIGVIIYGIHLRFTRNKRRGN